MRYLLTASPAFVARHFPNGLTAAALAKAPAVAFDQRDDMHISYMARHFALPRWLPLPHGAILRGLRRHGGAGAGLLPHPGIADPPATGRGRLLDLNPDHHLVEQLYWHRWVLEQGCTSRYPSA